MLGGAKSQNLRPKTSGQGNADRRRPRSIARLTFRAAAAVLARNGVGPSKRSVIGDVKNPGQTMVTPTPRGASRGRSASA